VGSTTSSGLDSDGIEPTLAMERRRDPSSSVGRNTTASLGEYQEPRSIRGGADQDEVVSEVKCTASNHTGRGLLPIIATTVVRVTGVGASATAPSVALTRPCAVRGRGHRVAEPGGGLPAGDAATPTATTLVRWRSSHGRGMR
jgi:hypothetical protein